VRRGLRPGRRGGGRPAGGPPGLPARRPLRPPRRASRRRPPLRQPRLRRQRRLLTALPATVFGPCRSLSKKVPSSRHVRMDGTHTGKLSAESVRAALRRVRGSVLNFVPRDCEAEARPADETAEAEQGQRSAFCKPAATGAAKAGNRNHQGEGISVPRMQAEMGPPWSVSLLRHAGPSPLEKERGSFGLCIDFPAQNRYTLKRIGSPGRPPRPPAETEDKPYEDRTHQ